MMGETTPDYDGIWGVLDPVGNGFLGDDEPHPSLIDSVGSDDFLLMDDDVRMNDHIVSSITDHGWDLSGGPMAEIHHLPSFLQDLDEAYDDRAPRTPSPTNRSLVKAEDRLHEVTPEKTTTESSCLPNMTELHLQYHRTLKK